MISVNVINDFIVEKNQLFDSSFERRVGEKYFVPKHVDSLVKLEGLCPAIIVPEQYTYRFLSVVYKKDFFEQEVIDRYLIPSKGRNYYSKTEWIHGTSPDGFYPSIICPKELVGRVVTVSSTY